MTEEGAVASAAATPGDVRRNIGRKTVGNALWSCLSFAGLWAKLGDDGMKAATYRGG